MNLQTTWQVCKGCGRNSRRENLLLKIRGAVVIELLKNAGFSNISQFMIPTWANLSKQDKQLGLNKQNNK